MRIIELVVLLCFFDFFYWFTISIEDLKLTNEVWCVAFTFLGDKRRLIKRLDEI